MNSDTEDYDTENYDTETEYDIGEPERVDRREFDLEKIFYRLTEVAHSYSIIRNGKYVTLDEASIANTNIAIHTYVLKGKLPEIIDYNLNDDLDKLISAILLSYIYHHKNTIYRLYPKIEQYIARLGDFILNKFDYTKINPTNSYKLLAVYTSGYNSDLLQIKGWSIFLQEGMKIDSTILKSIKYDPKLNLKLSFIYLMSIGNVPMIESFINHYLAYNRDLLRYFDLKINSYFILVVGDIANSEIDNNNHIKAIKHELTDYVKIPGKLPGHIKYPNINEITIRVISTIVRLYDTIKHIKLQPTV